MKKTNFYLIALILASFVVFNNCKKEEPNLTLNFVGLYEGFWIISDTTITGQIEISAVNETNTIKLQVGSWNPILATCSTDTTFTVDENPEWNWSDEEQPSGISGKGIFSVKDNQNWIATELYLGELKWVYAGKR